MDRQTEEKLWYEINKLFFAKEKSRYNKGKVFQSNLSKNTVDGNCMTKKMLIVMLSANLDWLLSIKQFSPMCDIINL